MQLVEDIFVVLLFIWLLLAVKICREIWQLEKEIEWGKQKRRAKKMWRNENNKN